MCRNTWCQLEGTKLHVGTFLFQQPDVSLSVQSGRAIQHVRENIFTAKGGVRRGIPNVLVVLTDGRSQDDVNKVSKEMQMEG